MEYPVAMWKKKLGSPCDKAAFAPVSLRTFPPKGLFTNPNFVSCLRISFLSREEIKGSNLHLKFFLPCSVDDLGIDSAEQFQGLVDSPVEIIKVVLLVDKCLVGITQAAEGYLDNLCGILDLEDQGVLVGDEAGIEQLCVCINAFLLGVLLRLVRM